MRRRYLERCSFLRLSPREAVAAALLSLTSHGAPRFSFEGVDVVDLSDHLGDESAVADVKAALELIRQADSRRLRRLREDVRRIVLVGRYEWAGQYWRHFDAIALDSANVRKQVAEAVAMTIVHEAAHARISRAGVRYETNRARIEERCVAEEIAFARSLGNQEHLILGAEMKLKTKWWQNR